MPALHSGSHVDGQQAAGCTHREPVPGAAANDRSLPGVEADDDFVAARFADEVDRAREHHDELVAFGVHFEHFRVQVVRRCVLEHGHDPVPWRCVVAAPERGREGLEVHTATWPQADEHVGQAERIGRVCAHVTESGPRRTARLERIGVPGDATAQGSTLRTDASRESCAPGPHSPTSPRLTQSSALVVIATALPRVRIASPERPPLVRSRAHGGTGATNGQVCNPRISPGSMPVRW